MTPVRIIKMGLVIVAKEMRNKRYRESQGKKERRKVEGEEL